MEVRGDKRDVRKEKAQKHQEEGRYRCLSRVRCNRQSVSSHGESQDVCARRALELRVTLQVQIPSLIFATCATLGKSWRAFVPECPYL